MGFRLRRSKASTSFFNVGSLYREELIETAVREVSAIDFNFCSAIFGFVIHVAFPSQNALVSPGKGLLAADESISTIGKRFSDISLENSEENRTRSVRKCPFFDHGADLHCTVQIYVYNAWTTLPHKGLDQAPPFSHSTHSLCLLALKQFE